MPHKVDKIDQQIVDLLQEDGRMPCAEIARRVGTITTRMVRYRIKRLSDEGVIRVSAVVRPQEIGFNVIADVWLEVESGRVMEVVRRLAEFPQISYVACSTGNHDISLQVNVQDNAELFKFVTETINNVAGVKKSTMVIVPMIVKDILDWRVPDIACVDYRPKE